MGVAMDSTFHDTISSGSTITSTRWQPVDAPLHEAALETAPRFLYVTEQGALLRKVGHRIQITKEKRLLLQVPTIKLQGVVLYGNPQVSSQCLRLLLDEGVWLSLFTRQGHYKGRLQPPAERGAELRRTQWKRSQDPAFCLELAKAWAQAKLLGGRQVAAAYAQNYLAETLGQGHLAIRQALERIPQAKSLEELRGMEGSASRAYWGLFRRWNLSSFAFPGRLKRGASDPVNILLNFAYTLLTRELEGLLESAGLDPSVGFYHAPEADRPSLACDWVEEFRHVIADRLVLALINRKQIQEKDFDLRNEKQGARLGPSGLRTFLAAYETAMTGVRPGEPAPAAASEGPGRGYRSLMLAQLGRLLDCLKQGVIYRSHGEENERVVCGVL